MFVLSNFKFKLVGCCLLLLYVRLVRPSRAVKIMLQVTQIVRFLLERGLRFRNVVFFGHDLMSRQRATFNAPVGTDPPGTSRKDLGLAFFPQ